MLNQEVIFGLSGQSFFYDCPEGRPSDVPTVQVFQYSADDTAAPEAATTGTCAIDAVNTTLSSGVSSRSTTLALADITSVVKGRRYLLTDATDGHSEWVEVVSAGVNVNIRQPLKNDYAIGSSFQGCRITIGVDPTWVATQSKISDVLDVLGRAWRTDELLTPMVPGTSGYRLRWSYAIDGVPTLGVSFADLVRYQAKNLVTPLDVDTRFGGWIDRLPTDYQSDQGVTLIDEAFRQLKMDCLGDEQLLRRIRNTEVLRDLTILRANMLAEEAHVFAGSGSPDRVKAAHDAYQTHYDRLMREPKVPTDQTGSGSAAQPTRAAAWRR